MTKSEKVQNPAQRSACPISNTLDLIGDKWTLIVIRDMLIFNKSLYGEFLESAEGISTNILSERLKRLEAAGVASKEAYQQNPVRYRYRLTPRGEDLKPLLLELVFWGNRHIEGTYQPTAEDLASIGVFEKRD